MHSGRPRPCRPSATRTGSRDLVHPPRAAFPPGRHTHLQNQRDIAQVASDVDVVGPGILNDRITNVVDPIDVAVAHVVGEGSLLDHADQLSVVPVPAGAATRSEVISRVM